MDYAIVTFVLVLGLIAGMYWFFVVHAEDRAQAALRKRLRATDGTLRAKRLGVLKEAERLSRIAVLEVALFRTGFIVEPLQRMITQSGLRLTVGTVVLSAGCAALVVYLVVTHLTELAWMGLGAAPLGAAAPIFVLRFARERRLRTFEEQFPEAIDVIARTLRAGHAFTTGLKLAADELPEPVATEFRILHDRQNYGLPLPDALKSFAERVPILDARFFVIAVLTQRDSGGNLAEVLDNLGAVIRERFRVKRQVRAITAHGRITGWILTALPPIMAVLLASVSPQQYRLLVEDPMGVRMIVGAVILQIVGAIAIKRIVDVKY